MLTIKETAKELGVHWQTVRSYIDRGELKSHKIGKLVRIDEKDLKDFVNQAEQSKSKTVNIEIELRYFLKNRKAVEEKLAKLGAKVTYQGHIIDHWFIPINIKNREQHDIWFDEKRGCGIRIREQDNGYTGKITTSLETKRLTKSMNHNTFLESETDIENYEKGSAVLSMMDRKEFLTIDKNRVIYSLSNFKICIDEIKGYKTGLEIEISGEENRDKALSKIKKMAKDLGLDEKDQAEKSVTVSAMQTLAKFS